MKIPPLPPNEAKRLATLTSLGILDTPPEERFDTITRTAAAVFDTPIALISLVDATRQWFKSRHGLEAAETPRDVSFCGHAILGEEVFVVEDAWTDARFDDNPLVVNNPGVRFYAGKPLAAPDGERIGTLCLIDRKPRSFNEAQRRLLSEMGVWAQAEISLLAEREALGQMLDRLLDDVSEAVILANDAQGVRFANRGALRLLRYLPDEVSGRPLASLIAQDKRQRFARELEALARTEGAYQALEYDSAVISKNGAEIPVMLSFFRCAIAGRDITAMLLRPR